MAEKSPEGLKRSFRVTGMTCATCSRTVEKALRKTEGVNFAAVNLATETAFVVLERDLPQDSLEKAVRDVGYDVAYGTVEDADRKRYEQSRKNLLLAWAVTGPLAILMLAHMAGSHIPGYAWMEILGMDSELRTCRNGGCRRWENTGLQEKLVISICDFLCTTVSVI